MALGLAGAQPAYTQAPVEVHFFAADATQAGVIGLHFFGAPGAPVTFYEHVDGKLVELGTRTSPGDETILPDAVVWRCDRLVRRFSARAPLADGRSPSASTACAPRRAPRVWSSTSRAAWRPAPSAASA
jgi:hypothetical protein